MRLKGALLAVLLVARAAAAGTTARPFTTGVFETGPTASWLAPLKSFSRWAMRPEAEGAMAGAVGFFGLYSSRALTRGEAPGLMSPLIRNLPDDAGFRAKLSRVESLSPAEQQAVVAAVIRARDAARADVAKAAAAELEPVFSQREDLSGLDAIRARRAELQPLMDDASELEALYQGEELTRLRLRMAQKSKTLQQALVSALVAQGAGAWNAVGLEDDSAGRVPGLAPSAYFEELRRRYDELRRYVDKVSPRLLAIPGVLGAGARANFLGNAAEPEFEIALVIDADVINDDDKLFTLMEAVDAVPGLARRKVEFIEHRGAPKPAKPPNPVPADLALGLDPAAEGVTFETGVDAVDRPPFLAALKRQFQKIEAAFEGRVDPSKVHIRVSASWHEPLGGLRYAGEIVLARKAIPVLMRISPDGNLIVSPQTKTGAAN